MVIIVLQNYKNYKEYYKHNLQVKSFKLWKYIFSMYILKFSNNVIIKFVEKT